MILQRSPWRGCVAAVLAATAFQAAFAAVVWGQSGAATDRAALESLYDATGGENWTNSANWKTDAPLARWHGVGVGPTGRVTALQLRDNGLTGPIPAALGRLANLRELDLSDNDLSGPIPDELGSLANLEDLRLGSWSALRDNGLTGPIPAALGRLANLRLLHLSGNDLSGPIPDELGSLANLQGLSLYGNALSGPIPAALGRLANLQELTLSDNDLSGPISDELGRLANLRELTLSDNDLSGPIPDELGSLANLQWLSLYGNALTGPIPDELGRLANLYHLSLSRNALTGPVPAALGRLANLEWLNLSGNALTGPIPDELGRLANLRELNLSDNAGLSGPLPRSFASVIRLNIFFTQACLPAVWRDWLNTIYFKGRLCGAEAATVDVVVIYTPAAREAAGGAAEIEAVVDLMIAETNQAYEASGVRHRVALAGRSEVQYVETGDSGRDLLRLGDPSDGHMDEAHALRDRVGADLVHLIVGDTDAAGRAYLENAFSLSLLHTGDRVFAHELGHNFALLHDRYQAYHYDYVDDIYLISRLPHHGYVNQPGIVLGAERSRRWRTIMAYATQCGAAGISCLWLNRFSNPRQQYGGDRLGVPFGAGASGATGPADAAAVLDITMPVTALWRERPPRPNRPPTAAGALPDRTLPLPGVLTVDVSQAFVDPDGDPLVWSVSSSAPGVVAVAAAGARVTLTAVGLGTAQIRVTATDPGGLSAAQSFTATVADRPPSSFTDDPIRPGATPIRAVHFTELRSRIDGLRRVAGLVPFAWTDPVLRAGATPVRLVHLLELRQALGAAYQSAGRTPPPWTDAVPAGGATPIRAAHLTELRAAVVALE